MITKKLKKIIFIESLNEKIKKNIKKIHNAIIIIDDKNYYGDSLDKYYEIVSFCKSNKIPFFIKDNHNIANKLKANGLYISSKNTRIKLTPFIKKKFKIIGSAHNQYEYYIKKMQGCNIISLSPLFYNSKYSNNKILNPLKFNLIKKNWNADVCALGGINSKNIKKINLLNLKFISFSGYIKGTITFQ